MLHTRIGARVRDQGILIAVEPGDDGTATAHVEHHAPGLECSAFLATDGSWDVLDHAHDNGIEVDDRCTVARAEEGLATHSRDWLWGLRKLRTTTLEALRFLLHSAADRVAQLRGWPLHPRRSVPVFP